ncbi:MAG: beta-lactamase family protein [Verrucomicrobiales bacterium]|nr:beta-lactamase family protein [Verrucomicrobiales bacterium]
MKNKIRHSWYAVTLLACACAFASPVMAQQSTGTENEKVSLNVKSKFPFVDRSQFVDRGEISYQVPESREDGIQVGDGNKVIDVSSIIAFANKIEKQNQAFKAGKGKSAKKSDGKWSPKVQGTVDSLLIAKGGILIVEEYFADARWDRQHYQMSITKSIMSYAIGKAIEQGKIKSENDLILDYLPEVDRSKVAPGVEALTLKDLLTMSSGIRIKRGNKSQTQITLKNHAQVILSLSNPIPEQKKYKYDGVNLDLLGHILFNTTGKTLGEFAGEYIFAPMGIKDFKFGKSICGLDKGAAGMALTSRDMLKVGLMTAAGGKWNGKQVLNSEWVKKATAVHVNQDQPHHYGYFWWSHEIDIKGQSYRVRSARGAGGQYIFVLPELDLVCVFTSYYSPNNPLTYFEEVVAPSFVD